MNRISLFFVFAAACSFASFASADEIVLGDFTKSGNGWRAAHHIKDVAVSEAGTSFTVTDNDPWFLGPNVAIPAATEGATKVRFTITCEPTTCGGAWEVYHDLEGKGYAERKKFALRACGPAPYTQFTIDMPAKGFAAVNGCFRIDPPAVIGGRFTIKSFTVELIKPLWTYKPATPPELVLPPDAITLEGDGWRLRHDPVRMGAFRYESHGKTVEGCVGEPCVVASSGGRGATALPVDWGMVRPTVKRTKNGFAMSAEVRDAEGRKWRMTRSFAKAEENKALAILTKYECDETKALHVPYLTLFADRASNGRKHQAMLAGLEYLDDEPSSSTKDIRMPEANRLIPAIHRITAPFAALTDEKAWLAAKWGMPRKQQYSVVFDTPDRQFKSGGHLLAFWFPAVGKARPESELDIYCAEPYSGGSQVVFLRAGDGATVADALAVLVRPEKLPPHDKIDAVDTLGLLSHGWLDSKLRDGTQVSHAVGFHLNQASDAPALMKWLAAQIERRPNPDKALVKRLRVTADAMFADVAPKDIGKVCVSHIQRPVSPLLAGDIDAWLHARADRLAKGTRELANGFREWRKPAKGADLGETLGAADCNGYTAMALEELLIDATWSGDEAKIAKALAALDKALARYEGTVPRGAQPWEMPLHTPDIIASGLMVRCCALGYLLKPDAKYLKEARYWAYTGLSMVYLVPPMVTDSDGADPFGCYATCGVMGATQWDLVSWMGRPVQWCGLVYSAALYDYIRLCDKNEAGFWRNLADGIVASGVRQSHPASEPERQGLLPDSVYLDGQTRNPPAINPGDVQENLAEMLKSPYYALRAFPTATDRDPPVLLHMAGDAMELARRGSVLTCRIAAWPETESRLVLTRIGAVASASLNGKPLSFTHDAMRRIAVVTLPAGAKGSIVIEG